jgi:hypothetical protein
MIFWIIDILFDIFTNILFFLFNGRKDGFVLLLFILFNLFILFTFLDYSFPNYLPFYYGGFGLWIFSMVFELFFYILMIIFPENKFINFIFGFISLLILGFFIYMMISEIPQIVTESKNNFLIN